MRACPNLRFPHVLSGILAFSLLFPLAREAGAQSDPPGANPAEPEPDVAPPILKEHAEATYPPKPCGNGARGAWVSR